MVNDPIPPVVVKADPKKPFKVYALLASVFLTSIITEAGTELSFWPKIIIVSIVATLAVYLTPNPQKQVSDDIGYVP